MPAVSVIVPCFNHAAYLPEALASVELQTTGDWECIIVNDASVDDTEALATRWVERDKRFRLVNAAQNGGLARARNHGIGHARGRFILPLDADDKIHPEYLEKALQCFADHPACRVVYGGAEFFGDKTGQWELPAYRYGLLFAYNILYCSAIFRRSDWKDTGGYSEDLRGGLEDWDFWLKILQPDSEVIQLPDTLFYYRQRQDSMINNLTADTEAYDRYVADMLSRHMHKWLSWNRGNLPYLFNEQERVRSEIRQMQRQPLSKWLYALARRLSGLK